MPCPATPCLPCPNMAASVCTCLQVWRQPVAPPHAAHRHVTSPSHQSPGRLPPLLMLLPLLLPQLLLLPCTAAAAAANDASRPGLALSHTHTYGAPLPPTAAAPPRS